MLGTLTRAVAVALAVVFLVWRFLADWLNLAVIGILCTALAWWLQRQHRDRLL